MEAYLKVEKLYKSFDHVEALRGVSMEASGGEVLAIVGDNGAGKSTLIKMIAGVLKPDDGTIQVNGTTYQHLTPVKSLSEGVSTVYQDLSLGNARDVTSNIFLGCELTRFGILQKNKMKEQAEKLLENLEIQIPDVSVNVEHLSGGQRQGVAVARLVHQGGKIFIFDEPTAAMGLKEADAVLKLMQKLAKHGYAVILISHNLTHVFHIADKILVMRHGQVIAEKNRESTTMDEVVTLITGASI